MGWIVAIAATMFAVLGVLTLLDDWSEKSGRPRGWVKQDRERRSFLILLVAAVLGTAVGGWSSIRGSGRRKALYLLFDLEVILVQIEGLLNSAIAMGQSPTSLHALESLVAYLGLYGFKAARLLEQLQTRLPQRDYQELERGAQVMTVGLSRLKGKKVDSRESTDALLVMLSGARQGRAAVRKLIHERTFEK